MITGKKVVVGRPMKMMYPVLISSEATIAARIECKGPRWVRKAASGLRIERASMSRLTLDMIRMSWRLGSSRKACPMMKPKSRCDSASMRSSPMRTGFVEDLRIFVLPKDQLRRVWFAAC